MVWKIIQKVQDLDTCMYMYLSNWVPYDEQREQFPRVRAISVN